MNGSNTAGINKGQQREGEAWQEIRQERQQGLGKRNHVMELQFQPQKIKELKERVLNQGVVHILTYAFICSPEVGRRLAEQLPLAHLTDL